MKFIHITDTHLVSPGETLYGLDPLARLEACVADVNRRHADAAFAIVTGDLTHWGKVAAYDALRGAFSRLAIPYRLCLGNHDERAAFLEAFPDTPVDPNGFVQSVIDHDAGRFILLDSKEPGDHGGILCGRRLGWLEARLAERTDRPVYLFIHHPPFAVGLKQMDGHALREPEAFAHVLGPHAHRIRHLFCGHLHRPLAGSWRGIPFSTMRGTNHQVALDFTVADHVPGSHEPPAYAVVLIDRDTVVVHFHDYMDESERFPL